MPPECMVFRQEQVSRAIAPVALVSEEKLNGGKALYGSCGPLGFGLYAESQAQTHGYVASNLYGVYYGMYEPNSSWGYLGGDAIGVYGSSTGRGVLGTTTNGIGV